MKKRFQLPILILSLVTLSSCATIQPYIQNVNLISVEEEKQLGVQVHEEITKEMKIVTNSKYDGRVQKIGKRLASNIEEHAFNTKFYVVEDKTPNAFAVPGGAIYVHTGLIDYADDNNELAGVIAHELGHIVERHTTKAMSRSLGVAYFSSLILRGEKTVMKDLALKLIGGGILNKYGRADETEADEVGYYLLKKSGYPDDGLIRFLKKLQALEKGGRIPVFLSSHPPTPERIRRLEELKNNS